MEAYIGFFLKWMPESFFICLVLTIIVAIMALAWTDTPIWSFKPKTVSVVSAWTGGFWSLLAFTMQMVVLLATGNAVAASPPAIKAMGTLARLPKTRAQYLVLGATVSAVLGYIHWGLGMMGAIVLGRQLMVQAKLKGIKLHMPSMVATVFMAFLPSSAGISGAAPLYAATPNYLKNLVDESYKALVPETIPLDTSVATPGFILLLAACMAVVVIFNILMHPKNENQIVEIDDETVRTATSSTSDIQIDRNTPAEKANACRWIMYFFGGIGLAYSFVALYNVGLAGLNLNVFNFLFISLGLLLNAQQGPEYYAKLIQEGVMGTWGFTLQFPFYAGIFGIMSATGLGLVISHFFTSIGTAETWPAIAFVYSAVLNIFVPSGGSKFVIEAPYIVPTSIDLAANLGKVIQAYQMGDGTTNLIIPFFALPYLANFKGLKFSSIVAYTVPPFTLIVLGTIAYFLLFPG
jgi:short-chain fatty acids transporter